MLKHLAWILLTGAAVLGTLIGVGAVEQAPRAMQPTDPRPRPVVLNYTAELYSKNMVPPVPSHGHGAAFVFMNTDGSGIIKTRYGSLLSLDRGVSLHGPAMEGENATIIQTFPPGDAGSPFELTAEQFEMLQKGLLYVVVETEKYPDGEIRGQLKSVASVLPPT